jgi:hypothetical protein
VILPERNCLMKYDNNSYNPKKRRRRREVEEIATIG